MPGPNLFQVKRTSVAGREANTVTLPTVGEIGVNLTDGRMWVANSTGPFEIGANCNVSHITTSLAIGNSSVNVTSNSTQINASIIQLGTAVYVGSNVDLTTVGMHIGNTTVNVFANSIILKLANSTVNTSISVPTSGQYSATNYFLHANGSWVQVTGGGGSVRVYQSYTATGGQTTFTVSGGYTIGQIEVFHNGVHLANTEYTQNGSTVVLSEAALVGAIIEVSGWIATGSFSPVPGGSDTQVQFNDATVLSGSAGLTFDKTTNNVLIGNTVTIGTATVNSTLSQQGALNVTNQVNTATFFATTTANVGTTQINTTSVSVGGVSIVPFGQHTIFVPAYAMYAANTNGAAAGQIETGNAVVIKTFDFDTTTPEFTQFAVQMPKSWNEGTIVAQFLWSHPATTTNFGVAWSIEATAFADGDVLNTAFTGTVTTTDTGGTTDDIYISSESSAVTVAGSPTAEEYVIFRITRATGNASDNMAVDARLHGVRIHYTTDAAKDD